MSNGANFKIGIAWQNSGDAVADVGSLQWMEFMSESMGRNIPPLIAQGARGLFDENDEVEGPNTVDGDFDIEARPIELGWMLKAICGVTSSVAVGSAFQHVFQLEQSDWDGLFAKQPITIHKGMAVGSAQQLYDLNASSFELSVANGDFLKAKLEFVGGQLTQIVEETPTFETGRRFTWDNSSVTIAGSASPGQKMTELTVTINENLEAQHTLRNSTQPSRVQRTDYRSIEIAGTMKFDDQTELQEYFDQTDRELIANYSGVTEVASGFVNSLTVKMPRFKYREYKPEGGSPGKVEVSFTGAAKYDVGSATSIMFILVNTRATY